MLSSGHVVEAHESILRDLPLGKSSKPASSEQLDAEDSPDDLLDLADFSYAALLNALRLRHQRKEPYTWIGPVLVSINPCMYLKRPRLFPGTPHPFALVSRALEGGGPSAIIVTGESGAGKTEAVKAMLSFLVDRRGARSERVYDVIVGSNEALEAFGNAQTLQNNNSSRFGKLTEVSLDSYTGEAESAAVVPYMLEASRVTHHGRGELNYHVFYVLGEALEAAAGCLCAGQKPNSDDLAGNASGEIWERRQDLMSTWSSLAECAMNAGLWKSQYLAPASLPSGPRLQSPRPLASESQVLGDEKAVWKEACVSEGRFEDVVSSMRAVGLSDDEILAAMQVVLAVALLGNVSIAAVLPQGAEAGAVASPDLAGGRSPRLPSGADSSDVANSELAEVALNSVAELLAVPLEELRTFLGTRTTDAPRGGGKFVQPRSAREVLTLRDSVAREVYTALFTWLVRRVAARQESSTAPAWSATASRDSGDRQRLAILDIYGFEVCQTNGLEQMLINYCNERLQSLFNMQLFAAEAREYESEGLPHDVWVPLCKTLPLPALMLFEGDDGERRSMGIFALIDDEARCRFNDGSDTALRSKMDASLGGHSSYKVCRSASCFAVAHFAGDVTYDSRSFVETNANAARPEILSFLMSVSSSAFLSSVLRTRLDAPLEGSAQSPRPSASFSPKNSGRRRQLFGRTVIQAFRTELEQLIGSFERPGTQCHYLRCLKPNAALQPLEFDDPGVLRQCRYSGLLETVKIRHYGYAHRRPILDFVERYAAVAWPAWATGRTTATVCNFRGMPIGDLKAWTAGILMKALKGRFGKLKVELTQDDALMGRRKVFMRPRAFRHFEEMLLHGDAVVLPIQAAYRGYVARFTYQLTRQLVISLQAWVRGVLTRRFLQRSQAALQIQVFYRGFIVRRLVADVLERHVAAAVTIQRFFRGYCARWRYWRVRYQKALDAKPDSSGKHSARITQNSVLGVCALNSEAKENCPPTPVMQSRSCIAASPKKRIVMSENLTAAQLLKVAQQHQAHLDAVQGKLETLKGERVRLLRDLAGARTSSPPAGTRTSLPLSEVRVLAPTGQAANIAPAGAQCTPTTTPPTPNSVKLRPTPSPMRTRPAASPLQVRNQQSSISRGGGAKCSTQRQRSGSPALRSAQRLVADAARGETHGIASPAPARVPPVPAWATNTDPWATFAVNRSNSSANTSISKSGLAPGTCQVPPDASAPRHSTSTGVRSPRQQKRSISRGSSKSPEQSFRCARRAQKGDILQELLNRCGKISQMERDILLAEELQAATSGNNGNNSNNNTVSQPTYAYPHAKAACKAAPRSTSCRAERRQQVCQEPRDVRQSPAITPRGDRAPAHGGHHVSQGAAPFTPPPKRWHGTRDMHPAAGAHSAVEISQQPHSVRRVEAPIRGDRAPPYEGQHVNQAVRVAQARQSPGRRTAPATGGSNGRTVAVSARQHSPGNRSAMTAAAPAASQQQDVTSQRNDRRSTTSRQATLAKARKLARSASETLRRLHA